MSRYDTNASRWRNEIIRISRQLYDEFGRERGWPGIPPFQIIEAVISRESEGVPNAYNRGATGLMQIRLDGYEAYRYQVITGETVTENKLFDPEFNLRVGITGLVERWLWNARTGYRDWGVAAVTYWGGGIYGYDDTYQDYVLKGLAWERTDAYNSAITARSYYDYVKGYVLYHYSVYDPEVWIRLEQGEWLDPEGNSWLETVGLNLGRRVTDYLGEQLETLVDPVQRYVREEFNRAFDAIFGGIRAVAPRVAIGAVGIVLIGIGAIALIGYDSMPISRVWKRQ